MGNNIDDFMERLKGMDEKQLKELENKVVSIESKGAKRKAQKTARLELRITQELKEDLEDLAALSGQSITAYISGLIQKEVKRRKSELRDYRTTKD